MLIWPFFYRVESLTNDSLNDLKEQLRSEMDDHKSQHEEEFSEMSEKINKQAKNKNKQKQSEDLTDSSVRKIKEWFNASLNELKTKVWFCLIIFLQVLFPSVCSGMILLAFQGQNLANKCQLCVNFSSVTGTKRQPEVGVGGQKKKPKSSKLSFWVNP